MNNIPKRKLHINDDVWFYHVGKVYIRLMNPLGVTTIVHKKDIKGITDDEYYWEYVYPVCDGLERKIKCPITPSEIKSYLVNKHGIKEVQI